MAKLGVVDWLMVASGLTSLAMFGNWLLGRGMSQSNSPCTDDALRAKVIAAAKTQVGKADLPAYIADAAPQYAGEHPEWCGIFALWALHQAGLAKGVQWKTALGFVEPQRLAHTTSPKPGDVAYFAAPWQHHALVESVRSDEVDLINGNGAGGKVSLSTSPLSKATTYYSIQKFVDAAIAGGCA